jgi:hypothetical protein
LTGDEAQVLLAANAFWLADGEFALVDFRACAAVPFGGLVRGTVADTPDEIDGTIPQVANEGRNDAWPLIGGAMQTAQRLDVLFPDIVEKLDAVSLAHRSL